ncbi:MAG: PTS sugar transporter subunit IIA [Pedosphaera sp.]|nr:PTS sugar transporter subunit IIA [Pedosphaera sp.]
MTLNEIVKTEHIVSELKATNRWEAIDELVDNLVANGAIAKSDRDAVIDVVRTRENSMSTGIGYGIGIPHASTDLIETVVGALGRSKNGIDFEALDNQPVTLVVLFLVPRGQFQKHLHTLANIARQLHNSEFRAALENAEDADSICQILSQPVKQ